MEKMIIRTLRQQAWFRAKGELEAMLATTWPGTGSNPHDKPAPSKNEDQFERLQKLVDDFIENVEQNGLHE